MVLLVCVQLSTFDPLAYAIIIKYSHEYFNTSLLSLSKVNVLNFKI